MVGYFDGDELAALNKVPSKFLAWRTSSIHTCFGCTVFSTMHLRVTGSLLLLHNNLLLLNLDYAVFL